MEEAAGICDRIPDPIFHEQKVYEKDDEKERNQTAVKNKADGEEAKAKENILYQDQDL